MKRIAGIVFVIIVVIAVAASSWAVIPPPRSPYIAPSTIPAEIHGLRYIAGLADIDQNKYTHDYRPKVWAAFDKKEFALQRQRIDQRTLNKKARKLEQIDVVRIPYKKITDVWYGDDALRKLAVTNLPTIPRNLWDHRSSSYQPVEVFLDQRYQSPVVILYNKSRKKRGAIIVMGSHEKSSAVYSLLIQQVNRRKRK